MKTFVKENWYKLMVGTSMLMASFGFMIYAISPAYSNNNDNKVENPSSQNTTSPVGTNGVIIDGYAYWCDGGYMYKCDKPGNWFTYDNKYGDAPKKKKLP